MGIWMETVMRMDGNRDRNSHGNSDEDKHKDNDGNRDGNVDGNRDRRVIRTGDVQESVSFVYNCMISHLTSS